MSLVAYAVSSSDEDSEAESEEGVGKVEIVAQKPKAASTNGGGGIQEGNISDDEDDVYSATDIDLGELHVHKPFALHLPKPVHAPLAEDDDEKAAEAADNITLTLAALPIPKHAQDLSQNIIEEEDDEFLHKKVEPEKIAIEKPPPPPAPIKKGPVKITIPSLKDFSDVDRELALKAKSASGSGVAALNVKGSSLLNILPKAKSEQNFAKNPSAPKESPTIVEQDAPTIQKKSVTSNKPSLIPDTVKNRRPAHNTEGVDGLKLLNKKPNKPKTSSNTVPLATNSDSGEDDSDNDAAADFFSLKDDQTLPEVSTNEINALIATKAAKIAATPSQYLSAVEAEEGGHTETESAEEAAMYEAQKRQNEQRLDAEAMQALVGGNAKRRRKEANAIEVMEISAAQVQPSRDEWMRTALASATEYQPTGVLNDDEPAAGTRRKHQITYLAHKAKANEAELQAMWSVNRQNRRATQSKYGF